VKQVSLLITHEL